MICKFFSHPVGCLFILLIFFFLCGNFWVWYSPICWFLVLLFMLLVLCPENHCQDQYWWASSLYFLLGVLWHQVLCLTLWPTFPFNFCGQCETGIQFHSSSWVFPVFPALFVEKTILSPLGVLGSLVKHELIIPAES